MLQLVLGAMALFFFSREQKNARGEQSIVKHEQNITLIQIAHFSYLSCVI